MDDLDSRGLVPSGRVHAREARVLPEWADEAVNDELAIRLDPDPKSLSARSVRVIGYSPNARQVLVVLLVRDESLMHADFWGANGWRADGRDRRMYDEEAGP